ncbi:MAG: histidine kinase [Candidatus Kapabacteria bacterium]|nr:histidine kinase [Candidatus Kapabacteria bacterium]
MMNSIFTNSKDARIAAAVTAMCAFLIFLRIYYSTDISLISAITDVVVAITLFVIMFIAMANNIRYGHENNKLTFGGSLRGGIILWVASLIMVAVHYAICSDIFYMDARYIAFLEGSLSVRFIISFLALLNGSIIYILLRYKDGLKEQKQNEIKLLEKLKEAELEALKSQINPHFLFNSLNSISSLTILDPDAAQEMVLKLSDYLRYTISNKGVNLQSFADELENIERYLEIEKVRFGEKLKFKNQIAQECLKAKIPYMLLQPLYENAIKYGVYSDSEAVKIITRARMSGNAMVVEVENISNDENTSRKGTGIGLKNIAERMKLTYGSDNLLSINSDGETFIVKIIIPQKDLKEG